MKKNKNRDKCLVSNITTDLIIYPTTTKNIPDLKLHKLTCDIRFEIDKGKYGPTEYQTTRLLNEREYNSVIKKGYFYILSERG